MDNKEEKKEETPRLVIDILKDYSKSVTGIMDLLFDMANRIKLLEDLNKN